MPAPHSSPSAPDAASSRRFSRRKFLAGSAAAPFGMLLGTKLPSFAAPASSVKAARSVKAAAAVKRWGPSGACGLPPYALTRIWRGYRQGTSGQILVVPHGRNFLGAGAPHAGPWPYTQNVPMFWYGPGVIAPTASIPRQVTCADIAPTIARLVGREKVGDWEPPDGKDMVEVQLEPDADLRLIVVLVWDAGGRFVLDLHPDRWPILKRMRPKGVWFDRASVGSSPSNTAPIHATIGTGAFPRHHGVIDNVMKFPDGAIRSSWAYGPDVLEVPGMAERYQATVGSGVAIGMAGSVSWHLGMVGKGNDTGGPQPVVILKDSDGADEGQAPDWGMPPSVNGHYRFFDEVIGKYRLPDYFDFASQLSGEPAGSGLWRGKNLADLEGGWASPARVPYQNDAIQDLVVGENFGKHPGNVDLLYINYKVIDEIGHRYYASSPEMADCIRAQDINLKVFTRFLDHKVGEGKWALLLTADHGHTAAPNHGGGYLINQRAVQAAIEGLRPNSDDPPLLTQVRPMWLNIDENEMSSADLTFQEISKLTASLTKSQTATHGLWQGVTDPDEPVFDAVFAGSLLDRLSCWSPPSGDPFSP